MAKPSKPSSSSPASDSSRRPRTCRPGRCRRAHWVLAAVEFVLGTLGPAQRHAHGLAGLFAGGGTIDLVGRAFVELHDDVGIEHALDLHRDLRREEQAVAVDGRGEVHALFGDLAHLAQRKHLEAAGVGQDGLVPADELVQAAELADHLQARAQPQVEGVAEDDLGVDFLQFQRRHGLDRTIGAHRHEDGRLDGAVVQFDAAAAGAAVGLQEGEFQHGVLCFSRCFRYGSATWRRHS
jgi:hypothetical protein